MMNIRWEQGAASRSLAPDPPPADARFYQLGHMREPARILAPLAEQLGGAASLRAAEPINIWSIPGKSLQAVYRVPAPGGSDAIVTVRCFPRGACPAPAGGALPLAEWDALAWLFPHDPQLPELPAMLDMAKMSQRLASYLGAPVAAHELRWRVLSYLPGERCTLMYHSGDGTPLAVGKLQRGDAAALAHQRCLALWQQPGRRFQIAQPLGCDPALGARWEAAVAGQRLEQVTGQLDDRLLGSLLAGLAGLHSTPLAGLPHKSERQIAERIRRKVLPRVRAALPAHAALFERCQAALERAGEALTPRPPATIHGDFHIANILVAPHGPVLIDLDNLALGDPAYDLALFGGRLLLVGLLRGERADALAAQAARLPALYHAQGGAPVPPQVFAWYLAATLIGAQVKTCIRHQAPGMHALVGALLNCAERTLRL